MIDTLDGFADALAWFRSRVPMTDVEFHALDLGERDHAFRVGAVVQADMVTDVFNALDSALVEGDFAVFKERVGKQLAAAWGGEDALRLDTVFDTNMQSAFNAGRYRQMTDPVIARERPIWRMRVVEDGRTSKYCKPVDRVTLSAGDAYWDRNYPMRHFRCRTYVETLPAGTPTDATTPSQGPASGFGGRPPSTGSEWTPDLATYPLAVADALKRKL